MTTYTRLLSRLPLALLLAAVLVFGAYFLAQDAGRALFGSPTAPAAPVSNETVSDLMALHGCWNGPAPADMEGKIPGHVVVTLRDGRTVYGGPKLVEQALGQVFAGEDHGLIVWSFCR